MSESPHIHSTCSAQSSLASEEQCLLHLAKVQTGRSIGLKHIKNLQVFSLWKAALDVVSPTVMATLFWLGLPSWSCR